MPISKTGKRTRFIPAPQAKPKVGFISLFLGAYGLTSKDIDTVYAEDYVKVELEQNPLDARGVYDAILSAVRIHGFKEAGDNLAGPLNQIKFMGLVDQANGGAR